MMFRGTRQPLPRWCWASQSDSLTQRLWQRSRNTVIESYVEKAQRSQHRQSDNSGTTMQHSVDLWLCGYSPSIAFLKHQPSDTFPSVFKCSCSLSGLFTPFHHLLPLSFSPQKPHLVQTWKHNLVGCFLHSLWKYFHHLRFFSIRLFSFLGLQKKDSIKKKKSLNSFC